MKKYLFLLLPVFILFQSSPVQAEEKFQEYRGTHFIVYYKNASLDFIQKVVDKSEAYYNDIAESLGFNRYNFWLWDNRAKIYIYDNAKAYQATGQPEWSAGSAIPQRKLIASYPMAEGFFEHLLPHEIGHIIFREFVGFNNNAIPDWLDEGVASYQESLTDPRMKMVINSAVSQGRLIGLNKLFGMNPYSMHDSDLVNLFYAQSASLVEYLIKEFGRDRFVTFCQDLRDKKD
ncbi:MAG: hypothetical protein KJ926_05895, partial [Candidatus Omnitrophica bacterium]|nr:hypothetical protein [Candidatus Omnitrophota bacterium]